MRGKVVAFLVFTALMASFFSFGVPARADFGAVTVPPTTLLSPGQSAIIAWNGEEEILIISSDFRASGEYPMLRILPLPSNPKEIRKADFEIFSRIDSLIRKHAPKNTLSYKSPSELSILFHEKIGAHDITVVRASEIEEFEKWLRDYLEKHDLRMISLPKLSELISDYIKSGFEYFVLDLTEASSEIRSAEPIFYRFRTGFLYYPLKISKLAEGETQVKLFVFAKAKLPLDLIGSKTGLLPARYLDPERTPVCFEVREEELKEISPDIARLLSGNALFTALTFEGDLSKLEEDLIIPPPSRYDLDIAILPPSPTAQDEVKARVSLVTPTPCYEVIFGELRRRGDDFLVRVDLTPPPPDAICIQVLKRWEREYELGRLEEGVYSFEARLYRANGTKTLLDREKKIFMVSGHPALLQILAPTSRNPAYVGPPDAPEELNVKVKLLLPVVSAFGTFEVFVGGKKAQIKEIRKSNGEYELSVVPPVQNEGGCYDLEVKLALNRFLILSDVEENAVCYSGFEKAAISVRAPEEVVQGSSFEAYVKIENVRDFDAASYEIKFDSSVLEVEEIKSGEIGGKEIPVDLWNEIKPGIIKIVQNIPGIEGVSGSGTLAELVFRVKGKEGDTSIIKPENVVLSDKNALPIEAIWRGAQIKVVSILPGDANGDGIVNALDITKAERIIVQLDPPTPGADANKDDQINALDITEIERIIVGLK